MAITAADVFSVPIFFIVLRETIEAAIIVSVLLAFVTQTLHPDHAHAHSSSTSILLYKRLRNQIWTGAACGFALCLCIGGAFIGVWYGLGADIWGSAEDLWEGVFALIASMMITVMGLAMLRISKLQGKWKGKLERALEGHDITSSTTTTTTTTTTPVQPKHRLGKRFGRWTQKYALFILPFVTVLREGLEAVVFVGGVAVSYPASAFPLAVACGLIAGLGIGYALYRGGNMFKLHYFLVGSTCVLYLVSAGLFSRAVGFFENYRWGLLVGGDVSELGSGPGTYDIRQSVWHVNCCSPEVGNGGWQVFNAILGWNNTATKGTVSAYCCYWILVSGSIGVMRWKEQRGKSGKETSLWRILVGKQRKGLVVEKKGAGVVRRVGSGSTVAMEGEKRSSTERVVMREVDEIREVV
ncbi:high-affinity iron permease [Saitoella coloradoensis]